MFPSITTGKVNPQLTNVLQAYSNPAYFADLILPTVPGLKDEAGKIPEMGNSHLRVYSSKRALYDNGKHRIEYTIANDDTYQIDYYDESVYIPDRLQQQLQKPFDAKQAGAFTVQEALSLEREYALAAQLTSTSVLTKYTTLSGTSQYTDTAHSTPEVDIDTARDSVFNNTGREANSILMNRKVANALRRHPWFIDLAHSFAAGTGNKPASLSEDGFVQTLKAWYGFDNVYITKAIYVNTKEGQTETKTQVWGNDIVVFYKPASPSLFEPSFGYSFQLTGYNKQVRERRDPEDKGDIIECMWAFQDKILDVNCAYLLKSCVA